MLNYILIYTAFSGLVGFRQTKDPETDPIEHTLTLSQSGLYANDLAKNWLINKNIALTIEDFGNYLYEEHSGTTLAGQRVLYNGKIYLALFDTTDDPGTTPSDWQELFTVPSLSTWLEELREAAIKELVNAVLRKNEQMNQSRVLGPNSFGAAIEGNVPMRLASIDNKFYGYALRPCKRNDAQLQIRKVGLKVAEAQTLTFYLFHYSQNTPLKTYTVEITPQDAGKFVWKNLVDESGNPIVLDYFREDKNAGGDYALGLFRGDIAGDVYEQVLNTHSETYNPKKNHFKGFFNLDWIEVQENYLNGSDLFNVDQIEYNREQALFNLDVASYSDVTYQIVSGARLWARAIQLGIAVKLLSEMFQSSQLTRISSKAHQEIGFLLHGNKEQDIPGLKHQYWGEVKSLVKQYEKSGSDGFENNLLPISNFY